MKAPTPYGIDLGREMRASRYKWERMSTPETQSGGSLERRVGQSYVFMREGHDWHSCEVSVLVTKGKKLIVARCCDVCDGLLSPKGSAKRKLKTWTCTEDELW